MRKLAITGVGAVSPAGIGVGPLVAAASIGRRVAAPIDIFTESGPALLRKLRRSASITLYAVSALEEAFKDTGGDVAGNYALIAGVTNGALTFSAEFHRSLLTEGKETASPALFSESVLNAPAGNASVVFDIHGAVHTLVDGPCVAAKALVMASTLIDSGRAERVAVVCTEEQNELSSFCGSRFNPSAAGAFTGGAGAVIIEPADERCHVKGHSGWCDLSGYATYINPGDPHGAFNHAVGDALSMSGLVISDIDVAVSDFKTAPIFSEIPVLSFFDVFGYAFCVSTMWNIILAAMALKGSAVTPVFATGIEKYVNHSEINHVIIYTAEENGAATAVILSKSRAPS